MISEDELFDFIDDVRQTKSALEDQRGLRFGRPGGEKDLEAVSSILGGAPLYEFGAVLTMMLGPATATVELLGFDTKLGTNSPAFFKRAIDANPEWYYVNWLPIAGDGCGGYYIYPITKASDNARPIFQIRPELGTLDPHRYVASNVLRFIRRALHAELAEIDDDAFSLEYQREFDPDMPDVVARFERESPIGGVPVN